jgi:hypothetical protein
MVSLVGRLCGALSRSHAGSSCLDYLAGQARDAAMFSCTEWLVR